MKEHENVQLVKDIEKMRVNKENLENIHQILTKQNLSNKNNYKII